MKVLPLLGGAQDWRHWRPELDACPASDDQRDLGQVMVPVGLFSYL